MKRLYLVSVFVLMLAMLFLPLSAGVKSSAEANVPTLGEFQIPSEEPETDVVRLYHKQTGKIEEISLEDYMFSVVAAEMPALYETEALKAQTVAAYTYFLYKSADSGKDYDITDDFTTDQAFVTKEAAREKWGEDADVYEEKISSAVKSVLKEKIVYDKKPILAVYHAISSGKTENAADVWGGSYPYLSSVESSGDKLSPDYLSTVSFTGEELREKLKELVSLEGEVSSGFKDIKKSDNGSVISAQVGGKSLSGDEIRKALSLRSANFDISFHEGNATFSVRGYGHGVGMSQYGAHYMAMQGKTYKEILLHYYKDCSIE